MLLERWVLREPQGYQDKWETLGSRECRGEMEFRDRTEPKDFLGKGDRQDFQELLDPRGMQDPLERQLLEKLEQKEKRERLEWWNLELRDREA